MALEDYLDSEVAVAVAATAAVFSPRARRVIRKGVVYGLAGALKATDVATAAARGVARGASGGDQEPVHSGERGESAEPPAGATSAPA